MNIKLCYCFGLLNIIIIVGCNAKKNDVSISPDMLAGKYFSHEYLGDSIFIFSDKTYTYKYYHHNTDMVDSVAGTWEFKPAINYIFFKNFRFHSEAGPSDHSGTWSPRVDINEKGNTRLQYSEDVYYIKFDSVEIIEK